jgi:type II secretory pathway pseudopilin PulG
VPVNEPMPLKRNTALVTVLASLLALVWLGLVVQVRHELTDARARLRAQLAAIHSQQTQWAALAVNRQAWADAERACEAADRVEQLMWPVRTKLLCRLLVARDLL